MEFTHVVGQSPCPQLVGRLTIRNTGTSPFTTDVRPRDPSVPLSFGPDRTVEPGQSVTIDVFFNCNSRRGFIVTVDVLPQSEEQDVDDDGTLPPGSFNVNGIVR